MVKKTSVSRGLFGPVSLITKTDPLAGVLGAKPVRTGEAICIFTIACYFLGCKSNIFGSLISGFLICVTIFRVRKLSLFGNIPVIL
jgi:hypothetical protein